VCIYIYIYCAVLKRLSTPSDFQSPGTKYRVIGLAYLEDSKCYAGGSVATGRVSLAGQDKGEWSGEEGYPGPPDWGLRCWTSTLKLAKMFFS